MYARYSGPEPFLTFPLYTFSLALSLISSMCGGSDASKQLYAYVCMYICIYPSDSVGMLPWVSF